MNNRYCQFRPIEFGFTKRSLLNKAMCVQLYLLILCVYSYTFLLDYHLIGRNPMYSARKLILIK